MSNKGVYPKTAKELLKVNNTDYPIKKWINDVEILQRRYIKEDVQMTHKHIKDANINLSLENYKLKQQ